MDDFERTKLARAFEVSSVITVHYFEYDKDFLFQGESHDFWELVYADKGDVCVFFNDEWHTLKSGYAVFHKPMQFHNIRANGKTAPNVIVISFECHSPFMSYFEDKTIQVSQKEKDLIAEIIRYARQAFTTRLDDPFVKKLVKSGNALAEQYISLYVEELLLSFYSSQSTVKHNLISTVVNNCGNGRGTQKIFQKGYCPGLQAKLQPIYSGDSGSSLLHYILLSAHVRRHYSIQGF